MILSLIRAEPGDYRDLLAPLPQNGHGDAAHAGGGSGCDIRVGETGEAGAVRIDGQLNVEAVFSPVIAEWQAGWNRDGTSPFRYPHPAAARGRARPPSGGP